MGEYGQYIVPTADEMINFKVGQPAPSMLPLDKLRESSALKFDETNPMFLQYGHLYGYPKFRQSLAKFLTKGYGTPVNPERLFCTNGNTGAISLICSLFLQAGDLVFMEEPSYFLALSIMKDFKMNVRQIRMEEDGLDVVELERWLKAGVIPKMLYTIPTCHNPTGRTLSPAKRQKLVDLSVEYGFIIVADEVYQLLSFPHITPPPPMFTYDTHGTVLACGSFSKILAPALRLGWIQGSEALLKVLADSGQLDSSGGINPVIQGIVHAAIDSGKQQEHLEFAGMALWNRADALMTELKAVLPEGVTFEIPDGGYFVLVRLPDHLNAGHLLPIAQKHKVMFLPGSSFSEAMKNFLRLSFSWYDLDDLREGARRLAAAIKEYMAGAANTEMEKFATSVKSNAVSVAVHGAKGRLGALIVSELNKATDLSDVVFAGTIDLRPGKTGSVDLSQVDVVIDVTLPEGTSTILNYLTAEGEKNGRYLPLVVGTTGALPMDAIKVYSKLAPVVLKSNFSVGIPLLCDLVKRVSFNLPAAKGNKDDDWNVEVMELHHTKKLDAPSGTAKTLAKSLVSTGVSILGSDPDDLHVPVQALRVGDEIGQHTVYFAGPGERIEIKHQATRREVFAIGALRTAKLATTLSKGLHY